MRDIYTRAVAAALDIPEEQVTQVQRQSAKTACFGAVYRTAPKRTESELFQELVEILRLALKKPS